MKNIEIKYRLRSLDKVEDFILGTAGVRKVWSRDQLDTYYNIPSGRLKLREEENSDAQLIFYERANKSVARESNYFIYTASDARMLNFVLDRAVGSVVSVKKRRTLLMFRNVRIHLDQVEGLGEFLELESVVSGEYNEKSAHLNLKEIVSRFSGFDLIPLDKSYADLLLEIRKEKRA